MRGWKSGRPRKLKAGEDGVKGWRSMEGWRLEGWKAGRLEGWKAGRLEDWRLEGWRGWGGRLTGSGRLECLNSWGLEIMKG